MTTQREILWRELRSDPEIIIAECRALLQTCSSQMVRHRLGELAELAELMSNARRGIDRPPT